MFFHNNSIENVMYSKCSLMFQSIPEKYILYDIIRKESIGMKELNYAEIGTRIRQARKERGWSRDVLAKKSNISPFYLGHIERGTRRMSMDTFVNLCRALGLNADRLIWGSMQPVKTDFQNIRQHMDPKGDDTYSMYIKIIKLIADNIVDKP